MKATKQYCRVVLFIMHMLYKVTLIPFHSIPNSIQMKATEQYCRGIVFIMLYKVTLIPFHS